MGPERQASDARIQYGSKAAALVGRRVLEVRYWDIYNFADEPRTWEYADWHHAVMGVELLTDHGPSCVIWTSTFYPYGVEVFQSPMSQHIVDAEFGPESWEVSRSDRWRSRLNAPVTNVQTFWERFTIGPAHRGGVRVSDPYTVDVPVAMRMDFAGGPVWMVAGMPKEPEMREAFVGGDEIMVVFTAGKMRQIGFPDSGFLTDSRD